MLPFLASVSLKARTRLTKLFRKSLHCCNLQIIFKSPCRLSSMFCFKDKLPKHILSGVVYKFTCSRCNATYIGKSLRHLKVRASEHLSVSNLSGKRVVSHQKSAISDHILEHDHPASFHDFSTLTSDATKYMLELTESLLIKKYKPHFNKNIASTPLYLFN